MNELMEWLKSWQTAIAIVVGAAPVIAAWWRFREREWSFSARRHKRLRTLFEDHKWRKAAPFDLQAALEDAYGRAVTAVEMASSKPVTDRCACLPTVCVPVPS